MQFSRRSLCDGLSYFLNTRRDLPSDSKQCSLCVRHQARCFRLSFLSPLFTSHLQGTRSPPQFTGEGIKAERMSILPSARLQSTLELGLRQNCLIWEHVLPLACVTRPFAGALATRQILQHLHVFSATLLFPHGWLCFLMRAQALRVPSRALSKCRAGLARNLSLTPMPTPSPPPPPGQAVASSNASLPIPHLQAYSVHLLNAC